MTVFFPFSIGYFLPFISWIYPDTLNGTRGHKPGRVALARKDQRVKIQLSGDSPFASKLNLFSIDTSFIYTYITRVKEVCHAEEINHNN